MLPAVGRRRPPRPSSNWEPTSRRAATGAPRFIPRPDWVAWKWFGALLDLGADVNNASSYIKCTALHDAASGGHDNVVGVLLARGADANAVDLMGQTALHHAAVFGHVKAAQVLVKHGAKKDANDREGHTPAQLAAEKGHKKLAAMLEGGRD